jgi:hypothetical protein
MIDVATGNISIQNADIAIGPSLTRDDFLASALGRNAPINVENVPNCSYNVSIPARKLMMLPASLTIYFYHNQLESLSIVATDDRFNTSWDDWSETKELERKRFHDQWLADTAGAANAHFPWGQLSSDYDAKSGFSAVHLRYSWQGKPWKPKPTAR